jgi:hypothetical protein
MIASTDHRHLLARAGAECEVLSLHSVNGGTRDRSLYLSDEGELVCVGVYVARKAVVAHDRLERKILVAVEISPLQITASG